MPRTNERRKRTYAVLIEVPGNSQYGDVLFAFLGGYEGRTPREAQRAARGEYDIPPGTTLIAVPSRYWSVL